MAVNITGLQKITLLDYPEHIACTVFTQGCNFFCPFCHNYSLISDKSSTDYISEDQFFDFLKGRVNKLDGVAITGGEPLYQKDIKEFIKKIKKLGFLVKLDTNGSYPLLLKELIDEKLIDYVAMDVKNSYEKYPITAGNIKDLENVKKSIEILLQGKVDYEFRTTVVKEFHTSDDLKEIGKIICGANKYFIQNYRYSESVIRKDLHSFTLKELEELLQAVKPYIPNVKLRGVDN